MRAVFFRLIGVVTLMLAAAGLVGWLAGPLPGVLAASVVALSVIGQDTAAQLRLLAWLKWPQLDNVPVMRGVWAEVFYRTARQFRLWETRLAREEDKLRRFIEALQASPNGVILMDASDQIDWCNDTAAAHFGLDPQRDLRQHAVHLIRNPEFFGYMGAKRFDEPLLMRRNGARGSLLLSVQVISYGDGKKLLLSRDVTQVERTEAMRRDFVANVSHELKTPLTVVRGYAETLLKDEPAPDVRRGFLETMLANARRMQQLIDDLLDLSRIESGAWRPEPAEVALEPLVAEVWAELRERAEAAGLTFRTAVAPEAATVRADPEALRQVLSNLLDNAVHYTGAGGSIEVRAARDAAAVRIEVADTGVGIPGEHLPRIFERFYRVDPARSRELGGTGLGLAIVKHVVEAHGGRALAESRLGAGTTIRIEFPAS